MIHKSVLLNEVLEAFKDLDSGVFIDCTLGLAGHSKEILKQHKNLTLIGIDKDLQAINIAKENLKNENLDSRVKILNGGFSEKINEAILDSKKVVGILADIGVSSLQFDDLDRGFSFNSNNLDMRMNTESNLNAETILKTYSEFELEKIFREYGEIRESKKLARLIKNHKGEFSSAKDLSEFIAKHIKGGKIHPATLVFQALRIEVNDELGELKRFLDNIESNVDKLNGAILAIISFHSLEDRIVKEKFKLWGKNCICDDLVMKCECGNNNSKGEVLTKKPIIPSEFEVKNNPRARSAKLRLFRFH